MKWMLKRLNETSTWTGLAIVAGAGQVLASDPKNPVAWFGALAGIAAAVKAEKGAV